jgi:hypothetical protein
MKRTLPLILVLAALAAAALVYFRRESSPAAGRPAADFVPATTTAFIDVPDLERTRQRWQATSLAQIAAEPEWQEFTEKLDPYLREVMSSRAQSASFEPLAKIDPQELFLAELKPGTPASYVGGLHYRGKKTDVKVVLDKLRTQFLSGMAAPKSEMQNVEGTEVEVVTALEYHLAFAYADDWFFVADSPESMRELLQRYHGTAGLAPSLQSEALFVEAQQQTLPEPDVFLFARVKEELAYEKAHAPKPPQNVLPKLPAARDAPTVQSSANSSAATDPADHFIPETVAMTLKFDGLLMRDRIYARIPNFPKVPPMQNRELGFAAPEAYAYASGNTAGLENLFRLLSQGSRPDGEANAEKKSPDFFAAFGPEMSLHSQWDEGGLAIPTLFGSLDLRDATKARPYVESTLKSIFPDSSAQDPAKALSYFELLARSLFGSGKPLVKEEDGTTYWTNSKPMLGFAFTLGMSPTHLVFGLNYATAALAIRNLKSEKNLGQSPTYQAAMKTVPTPEIATIYVDSRQLFQRLYEKLRPMVKYGIAGDPLAAKYFDPGKVPNAETFARHLQPIAGSVFNTPHGLAMESAGSISFWSTLSTGMGFVGYVVRGLNFAP